MTLMRFPKKRVLLFAFAMAGMTAWAQPRFSIGEKVPRTGKIGDWFYCTADDNTFVYLEHGWNRRTNLRLDHIYFCDGLAVLQDRVNTQIIRLNGEPLVVVGAKSYFVDSLVIKIGKIEYFETNWARLMVYRSKNCNAFNFPKVQGQSALCVPRYFGRMGIPAEDCKTWGMLGTNGKWLIEPQFDGPFKFVNGIAEVMYYGVKRKINEMGEFVD
jgi:hypothetical protein